VKSFRYKAQSKSEADTSTEPTRMLYSSFGKTLSELGFEYEATPRKPQPHRFAKKYVNLHNGRIYDYRVCIAEGYHGYYMMFHRVITNDNKKTHKYNSQQFAHEKNFFIRPLYMQPASKFMPFVKEWLGDESPDYIHIDAKCTKDQTAIETLSNSLGFKRTNEKSSYPYTNIGDNGYHLERVKGDRPMRITVYSAFSLEVEHPYLPPQPMLCFKVTTKDKTHLVMGPVNDLKLISKGIIRNYNAEGTKHLEPSSKH